MSPNMDEETTKQADLSLGFINYIVAPSFEALAALLPDATRACDVLKANRERWERAQAEA